MPAPLIPVPQVLGHLGDVDETDATTGQVLTRQADGTAAYADPAGGSGGVTDHGALTGLGDDDHALYALADGTRGDFASSAHTHVEADITDLDHPGAGGTGVVVPPAVTVTDAPLTVTVTYVWGINGDGDPYYNSAGVTAGDEAVLVVTAGGYSLRPVEA